VLESLRAGGQPTPGQEAPLFGWWGPPAGPVTAALLHTPPYPVLLTGLPAGSARELAELLAGRWLAGVNAADGAAAEFAHAWAQVTGARHAEHRRSRLFRLGRLTPPDPMPAGSARVAGQPDAELLEAWLIAFQAEVNDLAGHNPRTVEDRLSFGGLTLWEVAGRPVAMAGVNRAAAGVVRVGPVYTPPELRGRGYAGAATAAVSEASLRAGAGAVVLFTDLSNPTSNALYPRLGYEPVEDRVVLRFAA
jgi:RimJ/RimL family protein N-acetyltransferase